MDNGVAARPLERSLGIDRLLKLPAITLTTAAAAAAAAAVIHKAEKNKAGRSLTFSQKAPFPPTGNYFFPEPSLAAAQAKQLKVNEVEQQG